MGEDEPLLFMHEVYRAKIVWTVVFNGVIGEVSKEQQLNQLWRVWKGVLQVDAFFVSMVVSVCSYRSCDQGPGEN